MPERDAGQGLCPWNLKKPQEGWVCQYDPKGSKPDEVRTSRGAGASCVYQLCLASHLHSHTRPCTCFTNLEFFLYVFNKKSHILILHWASEISSGLRGSVLLVTPMGRVRLSLDLVPRDWVLTLKSQELELSSMASQVAYQQEARSSGVAWSPSRHSYMRYGHI